MRWPISWPLLLLLLPGLAAAETYEGLLEYRGDKPWFEECATGDRWVVEPRAAVDELQRIYRQQRPEGGPLWLKVRGYLKRRLDLNRGKRYFLLVAEEVMESGKGRCVRGPDAALDGTQWNLVRLAGRQVSGGERRHPHLVFRSREGKVQGYAGCNHFKGGYQKEGQAIRFVAIGTTRMHCDTGYELETFFLDALDRARGWEIKGDLLELTDGEGKLLARFEAQRP